MRALDKQAVRPFGAIFTRTLVALVAVLLSVTACDTSGGATTSGTSTRSATPAASTNIPPTSDSSSVYVDESGGFSIAVDSRFKRIGLTGNDNPMPDARMWLRRSVDPAGGPKKEAFIWVVAGKPGEIASGADAGEAMVDLYLSDPEGTAAGFFGKTGAMELLEPATLGGHKAVMIAGTIWEGPNKKNVIRTATLLTSVVLDGRLVTYSVHYSAPKADWDDNLRAYIAAVESFDILADGQADTL